MSKPVFIQWGDYWICRKKVARNQVKPAWMFFLFTQRGLNTMISNFRAGNCPITEKGLYRYSDRCTTVNKSTPVNFSKRQALPLPLSLFRGLPS